MQVRLSREYLAALLVQDDMQYFMLCLLFLNSNPSLRILPE